MEKRPQSSDLKYTFTLLVERSIKLRLNIQIITDANYKMKNNEHKKLYYLQLLTENILNLSI